MIEGERKESEETAYGITSLRKEEASAERLLELNRGHWEIENRIHYVRDVTFDGDRSQICKGNGAHIMAHYLLAIDTAVLSVICSFLDFS